MAEFVMQAQATQEELNSKMEYRARCIFKSLTANTFTEFVKATFEEYVTASNLYKSYIISGTWQGNDYFSIMVTIVASSMAIGTVSGQGYIWALVYNNGSISLQKMARAT